MSVPSSSQCGHLRVGLEARDAQRVIEEVVDPAERAHVRVLHDLLVPAVGLRDLPEDLCRGARVRATTERL